MNYQQIMDVLSSRLTAKRLQHSVGVSETSTRLALRYGVDVHKAKLAGILHDCAREIPECDLLMSAKQYGIKVGVIEYSEPVLLHAAVGAKVAEIEFGVTDAEILAAIASHTVGGQDMSLLAKIIYLADFIEPGRSFLGVDKLRAAAEKHLDTALCAAYDQSIAYILQRGGLLHVCTVEGRNQLITSNAVVKHTE